MRASASDAAGRRLLRLANTLERIDGDLRAAVAGAAERLAALPEPVRLSARNLVHYMALRRHDLRGIQPILSEFGLSSLGRAEAHVEASLTALRRAVDALLGRSRPLAPVLLGRRDGQRRLRRHADRLLGPEPDGRRCRILVTLPDAADATPELLDRLIDAGMDVARINAAHGDHAGWSALIRAVRAAARRRGRRCLVLMDLAGPKLRTGGVEPDAGVASWHPERDRLGRVRRPALVAFVPPGACAPDECTACLPVADAFLAMLRAGDEIVFRDARSKRRRLRVRAAGARCAIAEGDATAYVESGTRVRAHRGRSVVARARIGQLPADEAPLRLAVGDELLLTDGARPGHRERRDAAGHVLTPAAIPCLPAQAVHAVRPGERIWFDDGRIGGVVRSLVPEGALVAITQARRGGANLRPGKGVNMPDTRLPLDGLTAKDLADLRFARDHADLVGLSFVRGPEDIDAVLAHLGGTGRRPGLMVKIETPQAFARLPEILLRACAAGPAGIMIARGDLAVEVGFARLAEVQEEILWLSEAAHLPVVWGTQVLEGLAKKGLATRAEVTDAAMAARAEGVMLNRGPYQAEAVAFLVDVLGRMHGHQDKKTSLLRRLAVTADAPAARHPPRRSPRSRHAHRRLQRQAP